MGERLINMISQHPALYDKNEDSYMDTKLKDNIWTRIARDLGYEDGK